MAYDREPKVVGELCPECDTPYIQGQTGAYCKPCYIEWAEKKKQKGTRPIDGGYLAKTQNPEVIKGQVRMHLVCAMIRSDVKISDMKLRLPAYTDLVMNGKSAESDPNLGDMPF